MTDQVEWLYRAGDSNGPCFHGKDEPEGKIKRLFHWYGKIYI